MPEFFILNLTLHIHFLCLQRDVSLLLQILCVGCDSSLDWKKSVSKEGWGVMETKGCCCVCFILPSLPLSSLKFKNYPVFIYNRHELLSRLLPSSYRKIDKYIRIVVGQSWNVPFDKLGFYYIKKFKNFQLRLVHWSYSELDIQIISSKSFQTYSNW